MPLSPDERQQLETLLWAIDRGGIDASTIGSQFDAIMSANAERVAAQRQGKLDLLSQIGQTGLEAAQSGLSENDLAALVHSMQAISPVNTGQNWNERVGQVLAPLYGRSADEPWTVKGGFPVQSFEQQTQGMPGGISPLADIGFDESDVRAITQQTQALKAQGLKMPEIEAAITQQLTTQIDPATGQPAVDPVTGAPIVDEAGQEFLGQFGGLISQSIRNAYLAAGNPYRPETAGAPPMREGVAPGAATGPTGPTGPTPAASGLDIGLPEILATGAGISAGTALAQGARGIAAPYGGGATGFLRGAVPGFRGGQAAAAVASNVPNPALLTEEIPGVTRAAGSSGGGVLSFLRALSGHFGIFPDYLPSSMITGGPLDDPYATRPA